MHRLTPAQPQSQAHMAPSSSPVGPALSLPSPLSSAHLTISSLSFPVAWVVGPREDLSSAVKIRVLYQPCDPGQVP